MRRRTRPNGELRFEVVLDQPARDRVTVDYRTRGGGVGTATAGSDYEATKGTLAFEPGETRKTVSVTLFDDAIDEGVEIFEFVLTKPTPAGAVKLPSLAHWYSVAEWVAMGTIRNTDPAQAAWLSRFGRAMATGVVDALSDRIDRRAQVRASSGEADLSLHPPGCWRGCPAAMMPRWRIGSRATTTSSTRNNPPPSEPWPRNAPDSG